MTKTPNLVKKNVISELLGVTERQIERYMADPENPIPIYQRGTGRGSAHLFSLHDVHEWDKRKTLSGLSVGDDGQIYDYESERARLTKEQADAQEMKNALQRRDVVGIEVLESFCIRLGSEIGSVLDAAILNVKRTCPDLRAEQLGAVEREITKARNRAADVQLTESDITNSAA